MIRRRRYAKGVRSASHRPIIERRRARWCAGSDVLWSIDGLEIPINPDEYYVVAVEANGNLTLARRDDGRLLLFAPDRAFDGVTPLAGCPPYTLLTIEDVPDLTKWIEVCAAAWRHE